MRYVIRNGLIYDGSGEKPYRSDILLENGKIAEIAPGIAADGAKVIEAEGMAVTPGFIDMHRHCDFDALTNPDFGELELRQGLTSVAGGNCGLGVLPVAGERRQEILDYLEPCLGKAQDISVTSYEDYKRQLAAKKLPLHTGCYVGTGTLKAAVKGYGRGPFSRREMDWAVGYLKEQLEQGALGLSMGIMYQPECYSTREEMVELLSAASSYGRPLFCHIRGEGDNLIPSVKEIIEICREAELPLEISHFKSVGPKNWNKRIYEAIDLVEAARISGQDVTVDGYPYCGGATTAVSLIPPSVMKDNIKELTAEFGTASGRDRLKREIYKEHQGWDNMVTAIGWNRILIGGVRQKQNIALAGMTFSEAARRRGCDEPAELLADLMIEENGNVGIVVMSMDQNDVDTVLKLPYASVISDALYGGKDFPHPRLYGSFPKIIREYVLERHVLSMEEAVRKMSALPAMRLGLRNRGMVKKGYCSDLNVFVPENVVDYADYRNSKRLSEGFSYVFVDGRLTMHQGVIDRSHGAEILKI